MNADTRSAETKNSAPSVAWRELRDALLRRIHDKVWGPGDPIPNEADLAREFRCARTTVNRALQDLADKGLVTRRRRAGTHVTRNPATRAMLQIPILRQEIEAAGRAHRHVVLERRIEPPPSLIRFRLDLSEGAEALAVTALHLADGRPYALDARWINLQTTPNARGAPFAEISPNEWLVQNAAYTHGELAILAEAADARVAEPLGAAPGAAILALERTTWRDQGSVTTTRISFAEGYRITTAI